jgi:EpsD family peptidyl-prolyl cis-trans isomerase
MRPSGADEIRGMKPMKANWALGTALVACIAVSGCGLVGDKTPKGQVVATVGGDEITVTELNRELAGVQTGPDAASRKAVEQAAVQNLITRKLLAQTAKDQKLDKTPVFALQKQQTEENMLAQAWQRKVAAAVAAPAREEAERYVAEHPSMFANRKVMVIDQIVVGKFDPALMKEFEPMTTLEQIEAVLSRENIDYQRTTVAVDSLNAPPAFTDTLSKLPPGEIFIFPRGPAVFVNQIASSRNLPFTGSRAVDYALAGLKNMQTQEAVAKQVEILRAGAAKDKKITYNDAYKPPAPKAANAAAAPAKKS